MTQPARLRSVLPLVTAGGLDAGFASLASFVTGFFAVRRLSPVELGAFALLFSAFLVVSQISSQLVFGPAEVLAMKAPVDARLGTLRWSSKLGVPLAVLAAGGIWLGALPAAGDVAPSLLVPLAATGMLLAVVSPFQDHLRKLFHLAHSSWRSATMSAVLLATATMSMFIIGQESVGWAPFGGLAIGNSISALLGLWWALRKQVAPSPRPSARELSRLGKWLLVMGLASTGFGYAVAAAIKVIAGAAALGYVEASRVVAQPLNVLALGLVTVVAPRSMEAANQRDVGAARFWRWRYIGLLALVGIPYAVVTGIDWPINPLRDLLPNAFAVSGLAATMVIPTLAHGLASPMRAELLGARLEVALARAVLVSGALELGVVVTVAGRLGAFAAGLGLACGAAFRWVAFQRRLEGWYEPSSPESPGDS